MTKNNKGFNLTFIILLGFLLISMWANSFTTRQDTYTKGELLRDLENENVVGASVHPNAETPTGYVQIALKDGSGRTLYATDVVQ